MRRAFLILASSAVAFSLAGCDPGANTETTVSEETPPVVKPNPSPSPAAAPPAPIVLPDLISSTDPNQRVQRVQGSRNDPFALIPTTPTIERPQTVPVPGQPVPGGQTTPPAPTRRAAQPTSPNAQGRRTGGQGNPNRPGTLAPIPNLTGRAPTPVAPPPPQPELARAVQVTGVVQIGGTPFAIVTAPNEPASRYVRVGQRLSNGQVLVRRIDVNPGGEPVVVLEQFGVEVVRAVGEGGAPATSPAAAPAAAVPSAGQPTG